MRQPFPRWMVLPALVAALNYTFHLPHDLPPGYEGSHRCCVCHTVGLTAPADVLAAQPDRTGVHDVLLIASTGVFPERVGSQSPRGPPAA